MSFLLRLLIATALSFSTLGISAQAAPKELLNVSYDPTREFYAKYNALFTSYWKQKTGEDLKIVQSHGGSAKQARSVIEGLAGDVVTLALGYDIDSIAEKGKLLPKTWQKSLPNNSSPYSSTIVFLVRKGNPKHIKDWDDLTRADVQVITPNPKTSGGARWNHLAAYGYALNHYNQNETQALEFLKKLHMQVPVLDAGARGASTTFAERGIGDVLISWENEALLLSRNTHPGNFEVVIPSISILTEPPVAVVEAVAHKKGTLEEAKAYLSYLYSDAAQQLMGTFFYRPHNPEIAAQFSYFPPIRLRTIADFGGWEAVQQKHFEEGGVFDQVFLRKD